jgi:hypothetical protein
MAFALASMASVGEGEIPAAQEDRRGEGEDIGAGVVQTKKRSLRTQALVWS